VVALFLGWCVVVERWKEWFVVSSFERSVEFAGYRSRLHLDLLGGYSEVVELVVAQLWSRRCGLFRVMLNAWVTLVLAPLLRRDWLRLVSGEDHHQQSSDVLRGCPGVGYSVVVV